MTSDSGRCEGGTRLIISRRRSPVLCLPTLDRSVPWMTASHKSSRIYLVLTWWHALDRLLDVDLDESSELGHRDNLKRLLHLR